MASSPVLPVLPTAKSSLEAMLDELMREREKIEKPKDLPPALPERPVAPGRPRSARRSPRPVIYTDSGDESESPEETNSDKKQELHMDQALILSELEKRIEKAEAELKRKEEEIYALQAQLKQYDIRCSEYEEKMKSMEDDLRKQKAYSQMNHVRAASSSCPAPCGDVISAQSSSNLGVVVSKDELKPEEASMKQKCPSDAAVVPIGSLRGDSTIQLALEDGSSTQTDASPSQATGAQDLDTLQPQIKVWTKDYESRLEDANESRHRRPGCFGKSWFPKSIRTKKPKRIVH